MNIVILDALTLGEGIDINTINRFGNLTIYQTTTPEQTAERIASANIIITNKVKIDKKEMDIAVNLELICITATGTNNINLKEAEHKGIKVKNVEGYSTEAVAQHTFSLILASAGSLLQYSQESKLGNWSNQPIFTMINHSFFELKGKKLGIIGYGNIGKRVAEIGKAFGMEILISKREGVSYKDNFRVSFDTLLKESDIISIHTPLSNQTKNLFTVNEFNKMKNTSIIINVARGGIINEDDLYNALKNKSISGAAIDVTETEPIDKNNKLLTLNNIIITPHMAWTAIESRQRLWDSVVNNIDTFLNNKLT
jgi:glycerate dehydrogenase